MLSKFIMCQRNFTVLIIVLLNLLLLTTSAESEDVGGGIDAGDTEKDNDKPMAPIDNLPKMPDLLLRGVPLAPAIGQIQRNISQINEGNLQNEPQNVNASPVLTNQQDQNGDLDDELRLQHQQSNIVEKTTKKQILNEGGDVGFEQQQGQDQVESENADDNSEEADDNYYRAKSYIEDKDDYEQNEDKDKKSATSFNSMVNNQESIDRGYVDEEDPHKANNYDDEDDGGKDMEENDDWYNPGMEEDDNVEEDDNESWNEESDNKWEDVEDKEADEEDYRVTDDFDDDAEDDSKMLEDVVSEELAKKNKPPTGPSSMVIFYTWMVVALLIVVVAVSTYQTRCKMVKLPFANGRSGRDDKKRLLEHEYV